MIQNSCYWIHNKCAYKLVGREPWLGMLGSSLTRGPFRILPISLLLVFCYSLLYYSNQGEKAQKWREEQVGLMSLAGVFFNLGANGPDLEMRLFRIRICVLVWVTVNIQCCYRFSDFIKVFLKEVFCAQWIFLVIHPCSGTRCNMKDTFIGGSSGGAIG